MPNRTTKASPFYTVYGLIPKQPVDLHPSVKANARMGDIVDGIEDIHK